MKSTVSLRLLGACTFAALAAVACTAGPDSDGKDLDTELLFTSRTITCAGGAVVFHLDPPGGGVEA